MTADYPDPIKQSELFRDHFLKRWLLEPVSKQEDALIQSAAFMDRVFNWKGRKKDPNQSLSWPRSGVRDSAGRSIKGVPEDVKIVQALLAMCMAQDISPLSDERILAAAELLLTKLLRDPPYLEAGMLQ